MVMKLFYEIVYRYFRAPWDIGAREELVTLVDSGRIAPCRAIDLGCGTGANAIYLAQKGFEMTGVDYAEAAIDKARQRAEEAGVDVDFLVDDLTDIKNVSGTFDFLLDYGVRGEIEIATEAGGNAGGIVITQRNAAGASIFNNIEIGDADSDEV